MSYPQEGLIEGFSAGDFTFNLISGPAASGDDLLGSVPRLPHTVAPTK